MAELDAISLSFVCLLSKNYFRTNAELSSTLLRMLDAVRPNGASVAADEKLGPLLLTLATTWPKEASAGSRDVVQKHIGSGEIDTAPRLKEAIQASKEAGTNVVKWDDLKARCGVGVVQGKVEVAAALASFLKEHSDAILKGRYPVATRLRTDFSKLLKWADGKEVTAQWDEGLLKMLGPKDSAENVAANKAGAEKKAVADKKTSSPAPPAVAAAAAAPEEQTLGLVAGMDRFGTPADNKQIDAKLLEEHLKRTGGKVVTRFPPEPNGYLHMGHALSMARVFGYAEAKGGYCILRYDDTNPEAEKQEYIDSIANDVKWMGYHPAQVTYASDNFQKLYDFAEQLIRSNHAYVCDMPMEAMREGRRLKQDSPFRNRSVEENLVLFRKMRDGYFAEGFCTLRVKGDMQHDNPNMRDFVA
jgi:glutaminyl-tRNA synthetase